LNLVVGFILFSGSLSSAFPAETFRSAVSPEHAHGIVAHIIENVADRLDLSVEMQLAPFARRLCWMKTGHIDMMGGLLKRREREAYIYFVAPPYVEKNRKFFYMRSGEESRLKCYEDLYKMVIGTKIGSRYFPRFDDDHRLKKEAVGNAGQNFQKLLAGRIDTVIYSNRSGHSVLMNMGIADQVITADYCYSRPNPVYIGISRRSSLMSQKARIEKVIRHMVDSGEMAQIIRDYYKILTLPRVELP
jgi:polar amino acid transport system substrate-binding protein